MSDEKANALSDVLTQLIQLTRSDRIEWTSASQPPAQQIHQVFFTMLEVADTHKRELQLWLEQNHLVTLTHQMWKVGEHDPESLTRDGDLVRLCFRWEDAAGKGQNQVHRLLGACVHQEQLRIARHRQLVIACLTKTLEALDVPSE